MEARGELEGQLRAVAELRTRSTSSNLKGVGRVQQTFIDTYTKVACVKLYDRKTPSRRRIYSTTVRRSVSDFGATARR